MTRNCEVCGWNHKSYIYTPAFYLADQSRPFKYDIVLCKRCGFLFADRIPSQKEYETFYKNNAKYAYNENISEGLKKIYQDIFLLGSKFLKKYYRPLDKKIKVLDIGCSVGYILNLFKRSGFKHILGIEPSWHCAVAAKKLYGIKVVDLPFSEFKSREKFGLIIMTGVLEHVCSLNQALRKISDLLEDNGLLITVVPDADKFSKNPRAPFEEFSLEHINYFNKNSLNNLMGNYSFQNIYSRSIDAKFYDSKAVLSFFKKETKPRKNEKDMLGCSAISRYISASKNKLRVIQKKIDYLISSNSKVIIWGAGSLTSRLLASTNLAKIDIKCFVDSNKSLQGKKLRDIKIFSPNIFRGLGKEIKVLILSNVYAKEMKDLLIGNYNFKGEILQI